VFGKMVILLTKLNKMKLHTMVLLMELGN